MIVELIAKGKEIFDASQGEKFDRYDLLADNLGLLTELCFDYAYS